MHVPDKPKSKNRMKDKKRNYIFRRVHCIAKRTRFFNV